MISRVRNVFIIASAGIVGGLVKNILLARELSKDELGLFTLLMAAVGFIYPLTLLGQQNAIVRFMADRDFSEFNWPKRIARVALASVFLTVIGVLICTVVYGFGLGLIIFLLVVTFASGATDLLASLFRAQGRYELSMGIYRVLSLILPVAVVGLLVSGHFSFKNILGTFSVLYLAVPIAILAVARRGLSAGQQELPGTVWKDGFFFWGSDLSLLVLASVDKFLIPKLLGYEALGEYFAIYSIMRIFDLALRSMEFVLLPHVKRSGDFHLSWILSRVAGIAFLLAIGYLIFGERIVSLLYGGKYDNVSFLIPLFVLLGVIRLLYVIPYSVIGAVLSQQRLKQLFYVNMATIVSSIVLSFYLIKAYGLIGAVSANVIVWGSRTIAGFGIMMLEGGFGRQQTLTVEATGTDV